MTRVKGGACAGFGEVLRNLGVKFNDAQFFSSDVFVAVIKCWLLLGTISTEINREIIIKEMQLAMASQS